VPGATPASREPPVSTLSTYFVRWDTYLFLREAYAAFVAWTAEMPREGAGQLPALLLEKDSLPSGHQARRGEQAVHIEKQPRRCRFVLLHHLLLAGIMLCCLVVFLLSLALTTSDVPSALAGANVGHVDRGANAPAPLPNGSYPLTLAEELQQTDRLPVNAHLLTMLLLACSFGASVLRMVLTNARRQGATCSWIGDDRRWLDVAYEEPSFLGVFRL
jgi:hypothetical protein